MTSISDLELGAACLVFWILSLQSWRLVEEASIRSERIFRMACRFPEGPHTQLLWVKAPKNIQILVFVEFKAPIFEHSEPLRFPVRKTLRLHVAIIHGLEGPMYGFRVG